MRFKCYNGQEIRILLSADASFLFSHFLSFDWGFVNCKEKNLGKAMSWKLKRVKKVSSRGGLSSTQQSWTWDQQEGGGKVRLL